MYQFTGYAAKAILSLRGGIKVYNKENLPKDTGFVIACTHAGWVDVVALGVGILPMEIHYMAKKELFENKLSGSFLSSINAFPVDRENPGPSKDQNPDQAVERRKNRRHFPKRNEII